MCIRDRIIYPRHVTRVGPIMIAYFRQWYNNSTWLVSVQCIIFYVLIVASTVEMFCIVLYCMILCVYLIQWCVCVVCVCDCVWSVCSVVKKETSWCLHGSKFMVIMSRVCHLMLRSISFITSVYHSLAFHSLQVCTAQLYCVCTMPLIPPLSTLQFE